MTATPIPRTLTLTQYGEMDVSRIDEMPPGRTPVETRVISDERLPEVIDGLGRHLSTGGQAYWVCPLVEESEKSDAAAAEERARCSASASASDKVGLVHGRMKGPEKDAVMARFAAGELAVLVATTVIEVGVDVPNATLMIVEGAERFGLAQLHQLRGRVGRGTGKSICLLLRGQTLSETGRARLALMRETNDGFRIAEEDLRLRGPGEILGTRQSGEVAFRVATPEEVAELAPIATERRPAAARPRRRPRRPARAGGADLPLSVRTRPGGRADPERLADQQPVLLLAEAELHRLAADVTTSPGRSTTSSSSRTAPSAILRLASPFDGVKPSCGQRMGDVHARRRPSSVGKSSPAPPSRRSLAPSPPPLRAASRPCSIAVASVASTILASLISAPGSALQPRDLVQRQVGEQLQEAPDIGVVACSARIASNRTGSAAPR